jgi:hypothetical protein
MQDDQIRQKFIGLAPADKARLPHLNIQKIRVVNDLAVTMYTYFELALLYEANHLFLD